MKNLLVAIFFAATVLTLPSAAFSQNFTAKPAEPTTTEATAEVEKEPAFGAGDFDILVNLGFNLLYLNVEPALDIGVIPIGDDMAISLGGGVNFGFCVLCSLVSALSEVNVGASNFGPFGRANFHLGTLGGLIPGEMGKATLDPYVGVMGGPNFYRFTLTFDSSEANATATHTAIFFGPALGIRLGFADNTLLLFGEYRYTAEVGFNSVRVEDENGTEYTVTDDAYGQRNSNFVLGIGLRI